MTREPRTEAGRRLVEHYDGVLRFAADILAIEDEAVALVAGAARAMFAQEGGVCVECGWVGDHAVNPDRFARECLTLPLREALRALEAEG